MTVFIVFTFVVTAIGVVVYLAMEWSSSTILLIEDGIEGQCIPDKNIICLNCWGLVEQRCGYPTRRGRACQCHEPKKFSEYPL